MIFARTETGERVEAKHGLAGFCPGCGESLIPKCGEINIHHWSHHRADCDPWYEPETRWHLGWKQIVRPEATEVVIGPHRADIVGNGGVVVELQHSSIGAEEIAEREAFYGNMVWVIDARPFRENFGALDYVPGSYGRVAWFDWLHAHVSLIGILKPLFFDLGEGGMREATDFGKIGRRIDTEEGQRKVMRWRCRARLLTHAAFIKRYLSDVVESAVLTVEGGEG